MRDINTPGNKARDFDIPIFDRTIQNRQRQNLDCDAAVDGKLDKPESYDHLIEALPLSDDPSINNLAVHRWRHDLPDDHQTVQLVRKAQAGDPDAKTELIKNFHRLFLKIAEKFAPDPKRKLDGPSIDDLIAAGIAGSPPTNNPRNGFLLALYRFDLKRNVASWNYFKSYIESAMREESKRYWNKGITRETRIDRYVSSHPYDTPEQISYALDKRGILCTPAQAADALNAISARRNVGHYSTTMEAGHSDDLDINGRQTEAAVNPAGSHDMYGMYGCFNCGQPTAEMKCHSRVVDALAVDADKRAEQRLRAMGRRAYALWLVRKDIRRQADNSRFSLCNKDTGVRMADYMVRWENGARIFERRPPAELDKPASPVAIYDEKILGRWKTVRPLNSPPDDFKPARRSSGWFALSNGTAFVRTLSWEDLEHFKATGELPPIKELNTNAADADEERTTENDNVRQVYARHQASGVRRLDGNRGGDTRGGSRGGRTDEPRDAAGAA